MIQREVALGMEQELNDIIEFGSAEFFCKDTYFITLTTDPLRSSEESAQLPLKWNSIAHNIDKPFKKVKFKLIWFIMLKKLMK